MILDIRQRGEEIIGADQTDVVIKAQNFRQAVRQIGLVKAPFVVAKAHREGVLRLEQGGDVARIDTARQKRAHRHVGDLVHLHRILQYVGDLLNVAFQ